jgi:ribonuclease HI
LESCSQDEASSSNEVVWIVFCDGSWAGAAAIFVSPSKVKTSYASKLQFQCTNNIAEYEALLLGLRKLKAMGVRSAILKSDSQVITGQVDKSSKANNPALEKYLDMVRRMESSFEGFSVKNILRLDNEHADMFCRPGAPLTQKSYFKS